MRSLVLTYKDIPGYEGQYGINVYGTICSFERIANDGRRVKGCWIKPSYDRDGYRRVSLLKSGRNTGKNFRVARLLLQTWQPQTEDNLVVNHIDGNKTNDSLQNLEWVTVKENTQHAWKLGLCKPYDRKQEYNRQGIIDSNKRRRKCGI